MKLSRHFAPLVLLALLVLPAGCGDDDPTDPSKTHTLANMWPNEDGRFWSFDATTRVWGTGMDFETSPEALPLPSLSELAAMSYDRTYPEPSTVSTGTYRLQFTDSITTESGVRRQNLVETLTFEPIVLPLRSARASSAFLRQLAIARPDLRARIAALSPSGVTLGGGDLLSLILHGGAWEKTADWVGTYGDLDQALAWKFLDSDLTTGHEFALQLVPALASDVFLRVRVLGPITVETAAGTYTNAIELFYVIDYGVSEATDENGESLGSFHALGYGSIDFVPGVGPVASYERILSSYGPNGLAPGYGELQYRLRSTGIPS